MAGQILRQNHVPEFVRGRRILWLVTVQYGGTVLRLSSDDVDITDADTGEVLHYFGVLRSLRFSEELDFPQAVAEGVSVTVAGVMPVSIAEHEAAGHRLEGSRAELARWVVGTDFTERTVIALGLVQDPAYGADDEETSFAVESVVWEEDVLIPPDNQRVLGRNWSTTDTLDPAELGLYYPIIYGTPGKVDPGIVSRGWITGSVGCWVDRTKNSVPGPGGMGIAGRDGLKIVLAGHSVAADRVYISTDAYVAGERFAVVQQVDGRGQIVSVVTSTYDGSIPTTGSTVFFTTDPDGNTTYGLGDNSLDSSYQPFSFSVAPGTTPLFIGWRNDSGTGGEGGKTGRNGKVIRDAGDVLQDMLSYTSKPIDRGAFAAARPLLAGFKIDCVIEAQVRPWEWIRRHLLPILPVSIGTGPDGLRPIVWRFDATAADAAWHMDAGANPRIKRAGDVEIDSREIYNSFSIDYAHSIRTRSFYANARLGAGPYDSDDTDAHVSLHCRLSQQRHRYSNGQPRVVEKKLESRIIYDTPTARAVLAWQARAFAFARRYVSVVVPEEGWAHLRRGQVGLLTISELYIQAWVVLVVDVQLGDSGELGVKLLRVEDPVRDGHRVPT